MRAKIAKNGQKRVFLTHFFDLESGKHLKTLFFGPKRWAIAGEKKSIFRNFEIFGVTGPFLEKIVDFGVF